MGKIKVDQIEERVSSNGVEILSTPKVDTISELTSAAGVTIDGVLLKDGAVQNATISGPTLTDYVESDVALTSSSGVISIDLSSGNTGSITLSENITDIDFTNVPTNGTSNFTMKVTQDGTGSRTMAINAITVNGGSDVTGLTSGGAGVTLSTAASSVDLVTFLFFDAATPLINVLTDFQ